MTLVESLRQAQWEPLCDEAANRIEELEKALRNIRDLAEDHFEWTIMRAADVVLTPAS